MDLTVKDRVALVTGSTTGLGKAMALALARSGARVAFNYFRNAGRAERCKQELKKLDSAWTMAHGDVSTKEGVDKVCTAVEKELGPVEILIVNATPDQPQMPIESYTWQHFQTMIDFFIKSPYLLVQRTVGSMKSRRFGRILNIGSEVFNRGVPNFTAYVSAKGGQLGFTRSLANELAPFSITVNMISPGWIPVERHEKDPQPMKDGYKALIPMGRWGVPDDVTGAAVFLCSNESSFITGQSFCINGGMTVWT